MLKFNLPKAPVGFGFLEFALHVLDHSPAYETRAQQRLGYKAVDAIEAATKAGSDEVLMADDVGELFKVAVDRTPIPRLHLVVDGKAGEPVPSRFYTPYYEAAENAAKVESSEPATAAA